MNKLISKIVGVALGLTLATGVCAGVVLGNRNVSKVEAAAGTASLIASDLGLANAADWTGTTVSPVTFSSAGTASNTAKYYTTGSGLRLYNGDSFVIEITSSYDISSATFTFSGSGYTFSTSAITAVGGTYSENGATGTLTDVTGHTVSIPVARTCRLQRVDVNYVDAGSVLTPTISLDKTLAYTHIGSNLTLTATKTNAASATVSWETSNSSVATVSDGVVSPVSAGTATITAKITVNSTDYSATCGVTVFDTNHGLVQNDPLTIAEAIAIAKTLDSGAKTTSDYYVSGIVSSIKTAYSSQYGNISLNFTSGTDTFIGFQLATTEAYANTIVAGTTEVLFKGQITNYMGNTYETASGGSIITGTTYPEPTLVNGTLAQLFANTDGNYKQLYQVTGVISAWYNTNTNGTKYGNFYLQAIGDTSVSYYIYGATATSSALAWNENTGVYTFTNPQDFLTDTLTNGVAIGDVVTMKLTRCDHTANEVTTPEAQGIVVSVTRTPTITIDQSDFSIAVGGNNQTLTVTTTNVENPTITWASSDTSVATVSDGVVSAIAAGTATITASITVNAVTYSDSVIVTVTGAASGPLENGGRYYIIATYNGVEYGLNAAASTSGLPTAVPLNAANQLTAFDFTITNNNTYEITTMVEDTKYYLVNNSVATSSGNNTLRITNEPLSTLVSKSWELVALTGDDAGLYNVKENTTGSTYRYLSLYNGQDWRGYLNTNNGVPKIKFVEEDSYATAIANSLLNDLTCDNGVTAPSTTVWSNISTAYGNVTIAHEKALLTDGTANKQSTDVIEQALAKYDYVVGKYNKGLGNTAYNDFLSRDPDIPSSANGGLRTIVMNGNNALVIVVITAFVSMTFVGGYFFLRKKKEN